LQRSPGEPAASSGMQRDLLDFFRYGVSWAGPGSFQLTGARSGALHAVLNAIASALPDHRSRCERGVILGWAVLGGRNQGKSYGRASVFDALTKLEALGLVTRERRIVRGGREETAITRLTPALLQTGWAWADARRTARKAAQRGGVDAAISRIEIGLPLSNPGSCNSDSAIGKASTGAGFQREESNGWNTPSDGWTLTSHTPAPLGRGVRHRWGHGLKPLPGLPGSNHLAVSNLPPGRGAPVSRSRGNPFFEE